MSIYILIFFIVATHATQIVFLYLQCRPLDGLWASRVPHSKCFTRQQLSLVIYIGYSLDAFTDLICTSITVTIIIYTKLSSRSAIGFAVLIGFGTLITACAIVKTITLKAIFMVDFTWESTIPVYFTIAEYYGGIVIASIPNLAGLFARSAKDDIPLYESARNSSPQPVSRKDSAWTMGTPRIPIPGASRKHDSISTFGMSDGHVGSRVTIVDDRLTVVEDDGDRLTRVAEEGDDAIRRIKLDNRSTGTTTLKSSHLGWNKEDVIGLGILGRHDTFGRDRSRRDGTYLDSISSFGHVTRPSTPKRTSVAFHPAASRAASIMQSSQIGSPVSPSFPTVHGFPSIASTPRIPKSSVTTRSAASSIYSEAPPSAGLPPLPSQAVPSQELSFFLESPSSPPTPKTPKTPTWTTSPSGFKSPKVSKTPTGAGSRTPTGFGARTPQGSSTPRGGSRPPTPKRSTSVTVPVSKYQAEMSGALTGGSQRKKQQSSDLRRARSNKALPRPPPERRVVDIPAPVKFDSTDTSY